ncbi:hypothetical protein PHO31112_04440 [Pandoraea horticolens]|uniref:Uncharacterized protein n=1 Tax=Pandoraea horticolens TaxID=2508298 RepID=A0A5E4YEQ9_9BURK|nr:hypothetical protein PHO31112_04440 [Pandoraea horticolens]
MSAISPPPASPPQRSTSATPPSVTTYAVPPEGFGFALPFMRRDALAAPSIYFSPAST